MKEKKSKGQNAHNAYGSTFAPLIQFSLVRLRFCLPLSSSSRCKKCGTITPTTSEDESFRPLPCLACNRRLTKGTKYLWMENPTGGVRRKGTPLLRYLDGGGSSCLPSKGHTASEHPCNGRRLSRRSLSSTRREATPPHSCLATIAS